MSLDNQSNYDNIIFTPFRIFNAKCNVAFSLKSAHKMGRLNEKRCKNIYLLLFLVGFSKHLFGYIFNLHLYYCKYGNACTNKTTYKTTELNVVVESLFEGILFIVLGSVLLFSSYLQKNKVFMFFFIGFILHVLFELLGIHTKFCQERCK